MKCFSDVLVECFWSLSLGDFIWLVRQRGGQRQKQTEGKREGDTLNFAKCELFTVRGVRDGEKKTFNCLPGGEFGSCYI